MIFSNSGRRRITLWILDEPFQEYKKLIRSKHHDRGDRNKFIGERLSHEIDGWIKYQLFTEGKK